jgi:hypothetical protein
MIKKKKSYNDLVRENKEIRAKINKEIIAFRSSAETVLSDVTRQMVLERVFNLALTTMVKDVAYKRKTAFEAKQWIDNKYEHRYDETRSMLGHLEWLEIDNAEEVLKTVEQEIQSQVEDFAIRMFFMERELLDTDN